MTENEAVRLLRDARTVLDRYRFWSDGEGDEGNNEDVIEMIERIRALRRPGGAMTVKELAALLEGLPPETPVRIHIGWDLEISETDVDEDGLILFTDDADVAVVNRHWYELYVKGPARLDGDARG